MKGTGKAACILPHGVLFRGNAEATIRKELVRSGYLKAVIGLPANLFYGTGIPACIVVLDRENATARKGVFMIDASKGFMKDGPKNRLREQDVHRIVDTFVRQDGSDPRYARMVPVDEIAGTRNDFNLNLPRYIDSTEPEDLQDIDAHLRGGIPARDVDDPNRLGPYWKVIAAVRSSLFGPADRPNFCSLLIPMTDVKSAIFSHSEFAAFQASANKLFAAWKDRTVPRLRKFGKEAHPKVLIEAISEDLLATFKKAPLLDAYAIYKHLMDFWATTMQDDCYLLSDGGWADATQPHEIHQVKNKDNKLVWAQAHDFTRGKRRFRSQLLPATLMIARYFRAEQEAITGLEVDLASLEQQLDKQREKGAGEEGLLAEVIEGEGEKHKITAKGIKSRMKEIGKDAAYADERVALEGYAALLQRQADAKPTGWFGWPGVPSILPMCRSAFC